VLGPAYLLAGPSALPAVGRNASVAALSPNEQARDPIADLARGEASVHLGPTPAATASVLSTIDVLNGTVHAGQFAGTGGGAPWAVLADPVRGVVYTTLFFSERVAAINASTGRIVADGPVGLSPSSLALSPNGADLFVGNSGGANVSVLNASTLTPIASIPTGSYEFAVDAKDSRLFVADWSANNVTVVNLSSLAIEGYIPTGRAPNDLSYDANDSRLFVANSGTNNVSVINASSSQVLRSVPVGDQPEAIRWDSASQLVYVANRESGTLSVFGPNATTVALNVSVGADPELLAADPARHLLLIGNDSGVEFLDDRTNGLLGGTELPDVPWGLDTEEPLGIAFATDDLNDTIEELNLTSHTVAGSIDVGVEPWASAVAVGPDRLLLTEATAGNVDIVNATDYAPVGTVPVGTGPEAVAFDSATGTAYLANFYSSNVSEITVAPARAGPSIPVGGNPDAVVVGNGTVFVASEATGHLTVIDAANGTVRSTVPAGAGPDALAFDNASDRVFVADGASSLVTVVNGTTGATEGTIPVGGDPDALAFCGAVGRLFVANFYAGVLTVIDGATDRVVGSVPVGYDGDGVACDGSTGYVYVTHWSFDNVSIVDGVSLALVGTVDVGSNPLSATYDPLTQAVAVTNPYDATVSVLSSVPTNGFVVKFAETGLAPGTNWSVDLDGTTTNSTGSSVDFREPNGSGSFTVATVLGYNATPASGSANVFGAALTISVTFRPATSLLFPVTFSDSGLSSATSWSVTLGGTQQSTQGASLVFQAPDGTYDFTVGSETGFVASPSSGLLTVNGGAVNRTIEFVATVPGYYLVTFSESNLTAGTSWSVALDGSPHVSTTPSITFTERNGTYAFSVGDVTGYTVAPGAGSVLVQGAAVSTAISFHATSSPGRGVGGSTTIAGFPPVALYLLVAILAGAVAAFVLVSMLRSRGKSPPPPPEEPAGQA
jgi:YVTN family beta-propeller protein